MVVKRNEVLCFINFAPLNQEGAHEDAIVVYRVKCLGTGVGVKGNLCDIPVVVGGQSGREIVKSQNLRSLDQLRVLFKHRAPACLLLGSGEWGQAGKGSPCHFCESVS